MKGKILISSPNLLNDMIFYKSIILLVDESSDGYTGFILNRPGGILFMKNETNTSGKKFKFNFGGPVSDQTFFITKKKIKNLEVFWVEKSIYWGNNVQSAIQLINDGKINLNDIIFFQGYSGWDSGQLELEIENGSWIVIDNYSFNLFNLKKNSWNNIIHGIDHKYKIWSNSPDDISLN
jgi:putative transcriptional regulator